MWMGTTYFASNWAASRAASAIFMLLPTPLTGRNTASKGPDKSSSSSRL